MQQKDRSHKAKRVTIVGMFLNILLTVGKLYAGIVGKSAALLADAIHSLSDIVTDLVVIAFVGVAGKESDHNHHYGHGKYETFATMVISFVLMVVGVGIFWESFVKVYQSFMGQTPAQPGMIAFWAAVASVFVKESLFWYTKIVGQKIDSQVVIANAWHHRSDAFSSVGTAAGVAGAIFLGETWRILDPLAGMIVSVFIVKVAVDLGLPSIHELLETSLPEKTRMEISELIAKQNGVAYFHRLRTRKIGNSLAVEVHVKVNKDLNVEASHEIATNVENALRKRFGEQTHVGVHIEPFYPS